MKNHVLTEMNVEKGRVFFPEEAGLWEPFENTKRFICPHCKEILKQCGDVPHTCFNLFCKKNGDGQLIAVCMCCGLPGNIEEEL